MKPLRFLLAVFPVVAGCQLACSIAAEAPFSGLDTGLGNLYRTSKAQTRSISPENFTGEKGKAGMATEGTGKNCARELGQGWKISPSVKIKAKTTFTLGEIKGPGCIQQIWMTPTGNWRRSIIRFYWDDEAEPSIECPVGDFFACGWGKYCQINSLAVCVNPGSAFNCYWQMPFRKKARITLENTDDKDLSRYGSRAPGRSGHPVLMDIYAHFPWRIVTPEEIVRAKETWTLHRSMREFKGKGFDSPDSWTGYIGEWWFKEWCDRIGIPCNPTGGFLLHDCRLLSTRSDVKTSVNNGAPRTIFNMVVRADQVDRSEGNDTFSFAWYDKYGPRIFLVGWAEKSYYKATAEFIRQGEKRKREVGNKEDWVCKADCYRILVSLLSAITTVDGGPDSYNRVEALHAMQGKGATA